MKRFCSRRGLLRNAGLAGSFVIGGCLGSRASGPGTPTATAAETPVSMSAGRISDFEDVGSWSMVRGSASRDRERSFSGSQSIRLELIEENRVAIAQEFDPPIDMTDMGVKLALSSDVDVSPLVQVFDVNGNRIDFKTIVVGGLPFQWFNFGITTIIGEPDLSAIEELRIVASVEEDQRARVWCDELHFVPRPKPGKILIHFDDTNVTDYSKAFPILDEYGFVGATFVNSEFVGDDGRLTLEQLSELQNAGWDICNHTTGHQDLLETPESEREAAIRDGKQWLVDHGFEPGAEYFAYPKSAYDEDVLSVVDQYQRLAFAGGLPSCGRISNELLIHRATGEPTAAEAEYLIDRTVKYGGITCLLYHNITDEFESEFEQTMSYLYEQASSGSVDVVPVREFDPKI